MPTDKMFEKSGTEVEVSQSGYYINLNYDYSPTVVEAYESALSEFSDSLDKNYSSYPATPVTHLNIPDVKSVNVTWNYNYYTRDERTSGAGTFATVDINNLSQLEESQLRSDTFPRFNLLEITPVDCARTSSPSSRGGDPNIFRLKGIASQLGLGKGLIRNNIDMVQSEGSLASKYFSSTLIQDDLIDTEFYSSLKGSIDFFGLPENQSGNTDAHNLEGKINTTSVFSPDGLQIKDSLANMQSQGISFAPSDVRESISSNAFTSVTNLDFFMSINNKLIGSIINESVSDRCNIYENELRYLAPQSQNIQNWSRSNSEPVKIKSDEFELTVAGVIHEQSFDSSMKGFSAVPSFSNEASLPVGYIIEKFEFTNEGMIEHDKLIIEGPLQTCVYDFNVRYGGVYVYNIKSVYLTQFESIRVDESGDGQPDEVTLAIILTSSHGLRVRVECIEEIPPNPPQDLKFHWDYRENSLMLLWSEELNPQRDVLRYQIFRRRSIDVPFTLIRELDFDFSTSKAIPREKAPKRLILKVPGPVKLYRDPEFTKDSDFIYSLAAVDARGFTSNYSAQFRVTFNTFKNKLKVELVSHSGAPKPYPNMYLEQDLFVDTMKDSGHSRMRIFFDPEYYDVFKATTSDSSNLGTSATTQGSRFSAKRNTAVNNKSPNGEMKKTQMMNLIGDEYQLQIINIDNQLSKVIKLKINDVHGPPAVVPLNPTTLRNYRNIS